MGDLGGVTLALTKAADRGVRGVLCHVLDPSEEAFPFSGRTIFESVGGTISHETLKAGDLKTRYLVRLAERKAELQRLCALTGWHYGLHHTDSSAQAALLWVFCPLVAAGAARSAYFVAYLTGSSPRPYSTPVSRCGAIAWPEG